MESMQRAINNNRQFLNMVVHDMRNPTSSIQVFISESIEILQDHFNKFKKVKIIIDAQIRQQNSEMCRSASPLFGSSVSF